MAVGLHLITQTAVDAALREFAEIGRERFLKKYGFGSALDYVVKDPINGGWADSKAIVGAAYGYRFPERGPLRSSEFSGGQVQVVRLLRQLGFEVASLDEIESQRVDRNWSRAEVELLVADYLEMLALELAGQAFNKSARRRALQPLLNDRSEGSIEFKRRNVSATLLELGYPTLRGYVPAENRQSILVEVIDEQLRRHQVLDELVSAFVETPAVIADSKDFQFSRVDAPAISERRLVSEPEAIQFNAVKRDFLEREARNRSLGKAGELFILEYEQWRLAGAGLGQLADNVRHVSVEDGDGLGYDIRSFRDDGTEKYIEVKTTALTELTPFFVSATEVRFARHEPTRFCLCRLFDFRSTPRFFELSGPIESHCSLDPTTFRARLH